MCKAVPWQHVVWEVFQSRCKCPRGFSILFHIFIGMTSQRLCFSEHDFFSLFTIFQCTPLSLTPLNNTRKASDCHYSYYLWVFFLHHQSVDIWRFRVSCRTQDCILRHQGVHEPVSEITFTCGSITFLLYALVTLAERSCTWVRGTLGNHTGLGARDWEQPEDKDFGMDKKLDMTWSCALTAQESQ